MEKSDEELMSILEIDKPTLNRFKQIRENTIKEAEKINNKKGIKIKILGISGSARDEFDTSQENSNSEELLKRCLKYCEKMGAETEIISLRKYNIKYCKACYSTTNTQCHFPCSCYPKGTKLGDDMSNVLYDKIIKADSLIFATPVNNFTMSTLMKTFIDRCISLDGSLEPVNPKIPKDKIINIKQMKFIELTSDDNILGSGMLRRFLGKTAGIIVTGHEEGASMVISNLFMTLNHFGMIFPPFSNMYAMTSVCNSTYKDKEIILGRCYEEEIELLAKNIMTSIKISRNAKPTDWKYDYKEN